MFCPKCGAQNDDNTFKCTGCGEVLHPPPVAPQVKVEDYGLTALIPYKNTPALVAYYLGVFSIIPCVGFFLGIGAFILGIMGLRRARKHPEAKGKVHAWVGIIAGGFFALVWLAAAVAIITTASPRR